MKCPECSSDNREGAKFCNECGHKLEVACPKCTNVNRPGSKFCDECGQDLAKPFTKTKPSKPPESYQISTDTEESLPLPKGERRQATIIFSDLSGYTAMNEKLDPEEVEEIMGQIKEGAVRIVESYGGIVNQFVGDEILALFGIPKAHEDDPLRAVKSALELHDMVRKISPKVKNRIGKPLTMHTGINTGLIVTNLRDDRDGLYGITGETVNTGARLKSQAEPDEVLVTSNTQKLIAPYFEMIKLEETKMKGKAEPTLPFRVIGVSKIHSRIEASEQKGFTTYTGRDRELSGFQLALAVARIPAQPGSKKNHGSAGKMSVLW